MICSWLSFDKGQKYLLFSWPAGECSLTSVALTNKKEIVGVNAYTFTGCNLKLN